ncbi:MAG: 2-succinyl-6-hydroxy-2,4-cyclohexadiene-1-carboxylate synthase [Phormidesmis sp.]
MPILSTSYHNLHYVTAGESANPPLLLLHGFLGSHLDFAPIVSTLSHHFYCIVPDLPGHGQTLTQPSSYTFPRTADSLLLLLRSLNISQTHLLGYSMGGRLALYLTCKFPDYFVRVILESTSPGLKTAEERQQRREHDEAIAHRLQTTPFPIFLDQWYQNPLFNSLKQHPDKYAAMLQRRRKNAPAELSQALRGLGTGQQPSFWEILQQIKQPIVLLVGDLDTKFVVINREIHKEMAARRQSSRKIVENCGHNIHLEAPATYVRHVLSFLKIFSGIESV